MNSIRMSACRRLEQCRDVQVGFRRRHPMQGDGLIGELDEQRVGVIIRVDGDRFQTQIMAGVDNPYGNFPAIGDQNALHRDSFPSCSSGWDTSWPPDAAIASSPALRNRMDAPGGSCAANASASSVSTAMTG